MSEMVGVVSMHLRRTSVPHPGSTRKIVASGVLARTASELTGA
jgi:hypothetical protein